VKTSGNLIDAVKTKKARDKQLFKTRAAGFKNAHMQAELIRRYNLLARLRKEGTIAALANDG
jgi:hypothetical protein